MNAIVKKCIEDNPIYCHAIEVSSIYDLQDVANDVVEKYRDIYQPKTIKSFLLTLTIIAYECEDENDEEDIYNYDFEDYIESLF